MKNKRQAKILELIAAQKIETQNHLAAVLQKAGFHTTQATVSRDIRALGLTKEFGTNGRMCYAAPRKDAHPVIPPEHSERLRTIFRESVTNLARAQNLVILKTLPGLAPAACAAIDTMQFRGLVGTLAGDDTAFLALQDNAAAESFLETISSMT